MEDEGEGELTRRGRESEGGDRKRGKEEGEGEEGVKEGIIPFDNFPHIKIWYYQIHIRGMSHTLQYYQQSLRSQVGVR